MSRICDRLAGHREPPQRALALPDGRGPQRVDQLIGQPVGRVQVELLARFVVLVDRSAVHAGKLRSRGTTIVREHGLQIERRADRLPDLAQRFQLSHRPREFAWSALPAP